MAVAVAVAEVTAVILRELNILEAAEAGEAEVLVTGGIGVQYAGWTPGQNGAAGSIVAAGTGGAGGVEAIYDGEDPPNLIDYLVAGTGGAGGTWGTAGAAGGVGNYLLSQSGGVGGSGGIAIDGVSYVTFATIGTVSGSQIN